MTRTRAAAAALAFAITGLAGPVGAGPMPAQEQSVSPRALREFSKTVVKSVGHPATVLVYAEVGRVEGGKSTSSFQIFYVSEGERRVRIDAHPGPPVATGFFGVMQGVQAGGKAPLAMSILIDHGKPGVVSSGPQEGDQDGFTARAEAAAASAFPGLPIESLPTK